MAELSPEGKVECWQCRAELPSRRETCWRCGARTFRGNRPDDDIFDDYDDDDEDYVDDDDDYDEDDYDEDHCDDDDWPDGSDPGLAGRAPFEQISEIEWARTHATMLHPSGRCAALPVGLAHRLVAVFLSLTIWWVLVVVGFLLAMLLYDSPSMLLFIGLTMVPLLGEAALIAEFGTSPGKFLVGLRVVDSKGSRPGWSRAIIRVVLMVGPFFFVYLSGPIGDIASVVGILWLIVLIVSIGADPSRRGIHDRIAGTSVIRKAEQRF